MADASQTAQRAEVRDSLATFEWRHLHIHVVTQEPLSVGELRMIERMVPKVTSVGQFADLVAMLLGRQVRINTERPSRHVRLEVGR
jgi:hypothetical protein